MKKIIFLIGAIILISILILTIVFIKENKLVKLDEKYIKGIIIEDLPSASIINITAEEDIYSIIDILKIQDWHVKLWWNLKLSPDKYVVINDMVIGLFDTQRNYCKVEINGKPRYFSIPYDIYENIDKFIPSSED